MALCDELRSQQPGSPHVVSLLATLALGKVPELDRTEAPSSRIPTRGGNRNRELMHELIDRLEHHRRDFRDILPVGLEPTVLLGRMAAKTSEDRAPAPAMPSFTVAQLTEPAIVVARELPPNWLEIDLTRSLREFEERVREERIRLEELRLRAMDREVQSLTLEPVSPERARRTLQTAIEKFNHGDIEQALFELEMAEGELRRAFGEPAHRRAVLIGAQCQVDRHRLADLIATPGVHSRLRRFLRHFPDWSVQPLFDRLALEPERRERRRLLDLLIVHGWDTRRTASSLLLEEATAGRSIFPWYVTRNLIFLLRRLVETDPDASELELMSVLDFADLARPHQIVTEAVGYLSRVQDGRSESRLLKMLDQLGSTNRAADSRVERAIVEHLLRMPSGRARAHAVRFLAERGVADGYHLQLLRSLTTDDVANFPEVAHAIQQALDRQRARGWRRWFKAPRRNAALEQTLQQVLSTALSA